MLYGTYILYGANGTFHTNIRSNFQQLFLSYSKFKNYIFIRFLEIFYSGND